MNDAPLLTFFPYYGGKYQSAPRYPAPLCDWIVEPFAGSAGYSLRYPDRQIVLVERNPQIAAVWQWLVLARPREVLRLPLLDVGQSVDTLDVPAPVRSLIGLWCNPGSASPKKTLVSWPYSNGKPNPYRWGERVRERIARQVERVRHWVVISGDYTAAPRHVRATWYVDPPYRGTRHYPHNATALDFAALAQWCRQRRGQVIVCEQHGADWLPFEFLANVNAKRGKSAEAVWLATQR